MTRIDYPELDETLYTQALPNGLTVCVVPRKGFTKSLAYFVTDYGSVHTEYSLNGEKNQAPAGFLSSRMPARLTPRTYRPSRLGPIS